MFASVTHTFALVWLWWVVAANIGSQLADDLLVDAFDSDLGVVRYGDLHAIRNRMKTWVRLTKAIGKDVQIVGANVIKPAYILKKINLKRGDIYNRDNVQKDLRAIYQMGFFTDRMKAVPIQNSDGSITLRILSWD